MPYIVTTHPTIDGAGLTTTRAEEDATTRRAVATLGEARLFARGDCIAAERAGIGPNDWDERYAPFERQCDEVPEAGGTVGPLPDGTVIEVERINWLALAERVSLATLDGVRFDPPVRDGDYLHDAQRRELEAIVDAYNEAQS